MDEALLPTPLGNGHDGAGDDLFTLRRTGRRPLRFRGAHLVEAIGQMPGATLWHEINLYRTQAGASVAELIVRRGGVGEKDVHRVEVFDTLDLAAEWLEGYQPGADVPVASDLTRAPLAHAALEAVQLRQQMTRLEQDYQALLSDVLFAIDATEAAQANGAGD